MLAVRSIGLCLTALPLLLGLAAPGHAQEESAPTTSAEPTAEPMIDFSAEEVVYENEGETVTARGQVRMSREGNYLAADRVSWDRKSRVLAKAMSW